MCIRDRLSDTHSRLHVDISLFIVDGVTEQLLRSGLAKAYSGHALVTPALTFGDYGRAVQELPGHKSYVDAQRYWLERLDSNLLPDPPEIALLPEGQQAVGAGHSVDHFGGSLDCAAWDAFKASCRQRRLTPTSVLACLYATALNLFSTSSHFMLNVMFTQRHAVQHHDVEAVVGNFSSTLLLAVDLSSNSSFAQAAQSLASQLATDMEHGVYGGLDLMQEINRRRSNAFQVVAPFAFTSTLGLNAKQEDITTAASVSDVDIKQSFSRIHTPQTWLDHQIEEEDGKLLFQFDFQHGVFPMEVCTGIVNSYSTLLRALATDASNWDLIPCKLLPEPAPVPAMSEACEPDSELLHESFLRHAARNPSAVAVVERGRELSYGELLAHSQQLAVRLLEHVRNKPMPRVVAVVMNKGWRQLAGVLACMQVRCTYLPVDAKLPAQRIEQLMELSGSVALIAEAEAVESEVWLGSLEVPCVPVGPTLELELNVVEAEGILKEAEQMEGKDWSPDELAYLIYTSGSTGVPKGVCCHHRGARNTICDLNERFGVVASDRVLALSSLSFDLSVYDVFGMLGAGGSVVVPAGECVSPPDPEVWLDLLESEQVTVWNTVPAFMELLCDYAEQAGRRIPGCLRLVWMSGDWIPTSLPGRLRELSDCASLRVISMGGATEAAVWSNMYEIPSELDAGWSSIPYGRPLRNQSMLVLDEAHGMRHCEEWVTGALYIGGLGVAAGYFRDEVRTAKQFVKCARTGELMFRTGDLARMRPSASGPQLEFLGREDAQVKLNGFRIELGEIEQCLLDAHTAVQTAVCAVFDNKLIAYVIASPGVEQPIPSELVSHCESLLPSFGVPRTIVFVESLPLSANGKVQRQRLPAPDFTASVQETTSPDTPTECSVAELVASCLRWEGECQPCAAKSFFELGGNSQSALRLLAAIRSKFDVAISVQAFFDSSSIQTLAGRIDESAPLVRMPSVQQQQQLVRLDSNTSSSAIPPLVLVCAAGASSLVYRRLAAVASANGGAVYAVEDRSLIEPSVPFEFETIQDAARSVVALLESEVLGNQVGGVTLGGWSYGGVVAYEAAKLLSTAGVLVSGLHLFDAPIVPAVEDSNVEGLPAVLTTQEEQAHFTNCVRLLNRYHSAPASAGSSALHGVHITNLVSSNGSKVDKSFDVAQLTTGGCRTEVVDNTTHWDIVSSVEVRSG
eukprot:TRINITY_DN2953_c0_g1_i5.p1 TRINITY_DN2953_c0_g1~~TRINITY_DN2953_c0_g1_i5.p1  ORF type:complete len:1193 (+),score=312.71 TRINITY_DN2953_c0_g1_i5:116-3694(+)